MYLVNRTRLPRDWKPEESLTWVDGLTIPGVFTREKVNLPATLMSNTPKLSRIVSHVQYTQTESNRLKAKTIRVSSRIKDFRLTGSPFSGTRLTGSQVANKCTGR